MFGGSTFPPGTNIPNPNKDFEVVAPPDDTVSCIRFSPGCLPQTFLIAGSWANDVRCWEIQQNGTSVPKDQKMHQGPVLDACWSDDGTKVFTASCDKTVKCWDLGSNQHVQVAQHEAPVKSCHWIKAPNYTCLMTGSWDKTIKFWDTKSPSPILTINLPERCYCADVRYPMGVVSTAGRGIIVYQLDTQPREYKKIESPLKYQHRSVSIFSDKKGDPIGFAIGSVEGRVAIQYVSPQNPKDNFTFKCHRSNETVNGYQDIYAVNDIAFHPVHGTLATVGSDGKFSFWDKDARTKLKTSEQLDQPVVCCGFNANGQIFAYAVGYDWSKALFGSAPGILTTRVGYAGGSLAGPTYHQLGDHTETVDVEYDPNQTTYEVLLDMFWKNHDPTKASSRQYMSAIFYRDEEQKKAAEDSLKKEQKKRVKRIATSIVPLIEFTDAELYHQKYLLQRHTWLLNTLDLDPADLIGSRAAARLNGYVNGYGCLSTFQDEASRFGLNDAQIQYVQRFLQQKNKPSC